MCSTCRPAAKSSCGCGWSPTKMRRQISRSVEAFDDVFARRIQEADEFYADRIPRARALSADEERRVARQAYAGLLWSKQFYHFVVKDWLDGDPDQPPPPAARRHGRNHDWPHLFNRDIISMPDKWEYPWYAAWDLAFHMMPMATRRRRVRQGAIAAVPARMVHAPQRPDPGLRIRVRRRESARARLGLLAGLQDDRPARRARPACSCAARFTSC